jgi:hypothetical protein
MAAIPEVAQTLEPVITPQELEMQLASVESMSGKWFLVTAGLEPGIYSSWSVFYLSLFPSFPVIDWIILGPKLLLM